MVIGSLLDLGQTGETNRSLTGETVPTFFKLSFSLLKSVLTVL